MKLLKTVGILVAVAGALALAFVAAPFASHAFDSPALAQGSPVDSPGPARGKEARVRDFSVLAGRGADIGVLVRDESAGVTVEEVRPDSPAEKAGFEPADVIVEFDGERVRSARQLSRLVQETPSGRTVAVAVLRNQQRKKLEITLRETRHIEMFPDLADRIAPFNFNFDFDLPDIGSGRRLGVTVQEMTDQLAAFFGAKGGVLVTAVTDGSPAAQAGLRAGDVIVSIGGARVHSREDLVRDLRDATGDQIEIGIVRDKKETTVKATLERAVRRTSRGTRV